MTQKSVFFLLVLFHFISENEIYSSVLFDFFIKDPLQIEIDDDDEPTIEYNEEFPEPLARVKVDVKGFLQSKFKKQEISTHSLHVRRQNVFQDYINCAKKPWYKPGKLLKVTFIGESAVDTGGPRREFFSCELFRFF